MSKQTFPILCAVLMLLSLPVFAQDDDPASTEDETQLDLFDDDTERTEKDWIQFYASLGFAYLNADGSLSVNEHDGQSTTIIDFDTAGLDHTDSSYWLTLNWRSAHSRWGAWFGSWRYDVTGTLQWEHDFEIPGKDRIPAGVYVSSKFDAKWYIIESTYSFHRSETVDAGIGFGFHMVDLDTTISARIEVGDNDVEIVSEQLDTLAPLPNALAYLYWKFRPSWGLVLRLGHFGLDYDKYSGEMTNAHAFLTREFSSRWVLGVGYQFVNLDLKVDKDDYVEVYDIDFSGPMAFARYHF